jgi:UDP-N-acetylmuramoyl-L-alanyl-D-glutamate--2,6-diaminopimelate ligase
MKVSQIFHNIPRRLLGVVDADITDLCHDSRQVRPGALFFALRGEQADGHQFIPQALERGAAAIVMERETPLPAGVAGILVDNGRRAMAQAAAAFFGDPTADMLVVGVTGTNGKTTTTYLLEAVLRAAGRRPAVMGTIDYRFGEHILPSLHTTPESIELLRTIAEFRRQGADALVMEVSSHALEQHRVDGVRFDVGIFTNLTPEHLDYHGDMERYYASKRRFFTELLVSSGGRAVINTDDPYGARLAGEVDSALSCGRQPGAAIHPRRLTLSLAGIEGVVASPAGDISLRSPLLGAFNEENLLGVIAAGVALQLPPALIAEGLVHAPQVPGRLEQVGNDRGALILVDYAHTGDALEKALTTLRELKPRRIVTVFGCGGDRDRRKRPVMGEIAARLSDLVVLTSDNPRTEVPEAIMDEIRTGLLQVYARQWSPEEAAAADGRGFVALTDRRQAITFAVGLLQPGDLLLVAGKGHEDYQIIGRERFHFDDREEIRRALGLTETTDAP